MKTIACIALLLVGCAGKPKSEPVMDAEKWSIITANVFRHHELPPEGVVWHVTPAQWEAAQGLYNPWDWKENMTENSSDITITGIWINSSPKDSDPTLFYKQDGTRMTYGELRQWKKSLDTFKRRR